MRAYVSMCHAHLQPVPAAIAGGVNVLVNTAMHSYIHTYALPLSPGGLSLTHT